MKLNELNYTQQTLQYHNELNPAAWSGWQMIPKVRERLIDIAQLFVDYLEMPSIEIDDVRLTGSMCNFNWTKYSDFDLHVVTDYSALNCDDLAEALYKSKKTIWNERHDITVNGHEVELYVEDTANPPHSAGMFSIIDDRWLSKLNIFDPDYDQQAVNKKVQTGIDLLQKTVHQARRVEDFEQAIQKIYRMRQSGLETNGEFSTENLAFKVLRNMGWLERIRNARDQFVDKAYSL